MELNIYDGTLDCGFCGIDDDCCSPRLNETKEVKTIRDIIYIRAHMRMPDGGIELFDWAPNCWTILFQYPYKI